MTVLAEEEELQRNVFRRQPKSIYLHNVVREKCFYVFSAFLMLEQSARAKWYSGNRKQSRKPNEQRALEMRINAEGIKHNFISGIVVDDDLTALIYSYNIFCEFFFLFAIYLSLRAVERGWNKDTTPPPPALKVKSTQNWCWSSNHSCRLHSNTSLPCKLHFVRAHVM